MTARAGVYSIANFELLKATHSPSEKRKKNSLLTGSRRLREPLDDHSDLDTENEGEGGNEENEELSDAVTETFVENEDRSAADEFFEGRGRSKEEAEKTQWPVDDDTDDETENEADDDSGGLKDGFFDRWA
jgi:hypothetical protein